MANIVAAIGASGVKASIQTPKIQNRPNEEINKQIEQYERQFKEVYEKLRALKI